MRAYNRQTYDTADLQDKNLPQFFIRLDQQKAIGRLQFEPLTQAGPNGGEGNVQHSRRAEQIRKELFDCKLGRNKRVRFCRLYVNPASAAEFNPPTALELTIAGTYRIRVKPEAAGKFSRAGQPLARCQIATQNAEDDLRDQLLAKGDTAAARKP